MAGVLRMLGVGIRAYRVAVVPWSFNVSFKYGEAHITDVAWEYLTLFRVPLLPLALSAYGSGGGKRRLEMGQKEVTNLLANLRYVSGGSLERQKKFIGLVSRAFIVRIFGVAGATIVGCAALALLGTFGLVLFPVGAGLANLAFLGVVRPKRIHGACTARHSWPRDL